MRRIFIPVLAFALLFSFSANSFAQTCTGFTTTAPAGTWSNLPYNQTIAGSSSATFVSDVLFSPTTQSTVDFRLLLSQQTGGGSNANLTPTITIKWGAGGSTTYTCSAGTPTGSLSTGAVYYYLSITPAVPVPANVNFQIEVSLSNAGSRDAYITGYSVETGIFAPGGIALPVKFAQFTAKTVSSGVQLNWTIDAEENTKGYEIERSADGRNYAPIAPVNANGARSYSFIDTKPLADGYYRIKATDFDGKFGYSNIVRMKGGVSNVVVKGFLSSSSLLTVQHDMAPAGSRISVTSADGRMIKSVVVVPGTQQTLIDVSAVRTGLMLVRYETSTGVAETIKIVKQ